MPADELGATVHDDVDAVVDGSKEQGRRDRIVADDRHVVLMRHLDDPGEIENIVFRVADALDVDEPGIVLDRLGEVGRVAGVNKRHLDAQLGEGVAKQSHRPAVERAGRDDVLSGPTDVQDGGGNGPHAGAETKPRDATFQCGEPLFQHIDRRIHDPRVDIAEFLEGEEPGGVVGVVEAVAARLIDRHGSTVRVRVDIVAAVQGDGFQMMFVLSHTYSPSVKPLGEASVLWEDFYHAIQGPPGGNRNLRWYGDLVL